MFVFDPIEQLGLLAIGLFTLGLIGAAIQKSRQGAFGLSSSGIRPAFLNCASTVGRSS